VIDLAEPSMAQQDADLLKVLVGQVSKDRDIDSILGKALGVLGPPGAVAAGAGATGPALGLEEIVTVEMTRGTVFGASRMSIGCSFSLEPELVTDVWLELLRQVSLLFRTMLLGQVPDMTIGGSAGNTYPPNMARWTNVPASTAKASTAITARRPLRQREPGHHRNNDRRHKLRQSRRPGYLRCDGHRTRWARILVLVGSAKPAADHLGPAKPAASGRGIEFCRHRACPPTEPPTAAREQRERSGASA
jgi:hypothetical protein